jgi:hypothetical protein
VKREAEGDWGCVGVAFPVQHPRPLFDADPRNLDKMALACWEKAVAGDTSAFTFIRDTMDGKPIQRSDISIAQQHRPSEELSDEELAARIAELEEECALH